MYAVLKFDNGLYRKAFMYYIHVRFYNTTKGCNMITTHVSCLHQFVYRVISKLHADFKSIIKHISGAPENILLSVQGPRGLEMIWSTPRNDSRDGYFENFQVICVTGTNRNIVYSNLIEDRHASGDVIMQGVTPYTGYNCCVLMTTSEGSSPYACAAATTDQDSKSLVC